MVGIGSHNNLSIVYASCTTLQRCFAMELRDGASRFLSPRLPNSSKSRKIVKSQHEHERIAVASSQPGAPYANFKEKCAELKDTSASCVLLNGEKFHSTEVALIVMAPTSDTVAICFADALIVMAPSLR